MNQTTLTRKSILAAACFCFATSLAAQTTGQQEPQMVASLSRPASIPAMPSVVTPPPAHSSAASAATPVSSPSADTPQVKLLASSSLPTSVSLSAATAVRWSAVTPAATHSSSRKSWISVEPGTVPPAPLYQEAPSDNPYGPAPAFVNLRLGHK
jgi:hypothetical protein